MMNEEPLVGTMESEQLALASAIKRLEGDTSDGSNKMREYFNRRLTDNFQAQSREAGVHQTICHPSSIDKTVGNITYMKPPRFMHKSRIIRTLDRITCWIDPKA